MNETLIVGAAIGDCVHVAGVVNFLNLAEQLGYETVCLGPAVSVDELLEKVAALDPGLVAVGYRLTPENCRNLLAEQWDYTMRTNPEYASILGDKRFNDKLTDFSEQAIQADIAEQKRFLARFQAVDPGDSPSRRRSTAR